MALPSWDRVMQDPRFQGLGPADQALVRRRWEARAGAFPASDDDSGAPPARVGVGWIDQLSPEDQAGLRTALHRLPTMEQRTEQIGLATGRLMRDPEGDVQPTSPPPPRPTLRSRVEETLGYPLFRGAARVQRAIEAPFERAGQYVEDTVEPYAEKILPPAAARLASRLAGGVVSYAPYGPLYAALPEAGAGEFLAGGLRGVLGRTAASSLLTAGIEGERAGARAIDEGRALEPGELGEAAAGGAAGGAAGHLLLGEVAAPAVRGLVRRLRGAIPPAEPTRATPDFVGTPGGQVIDTAKAGLVDTASDADLQVAASAGDQAAVDALRARLRARGTIAPEEAASRIAQGLLPEPRKLLPAPTHAADPTATVGTAEVIGQVAQGMGKEPAPPPPAAPPPEPVRVALPPPEREPPAATPAPGPGPAPSPTPAPPAAEPEMAPARSYDEAQRAVDDFEDALDAKYGLPKNQAAIHPDSLLTPEELRQRREVYGQRDVIMHAEDDAHAAGAKQTLPEGPLPRADAEATVDRILANEKIHRATGSRDVMDRAGAEGLVREVYGNIAHRLGFPEELSSIEDAMDAIRRAPRAPAVARAAEALEQARGIVRSVIGGGAKPEQAVPGDVARLGAEGPLVHVAESAPDLQRHLVETGRGETGVVPAKEAPPALPERPAGLVGKAAKISVEDHPKVDVQYEVVPVEDAIASHDPHTFRENPEYAQQLQPRDRSRPAYQAQVQRMRNNLEPDQLGASPLGSHGAPIVGPDSLVEGGNGRTMAMQGIPEGDPRWDTYKAWLKEHAGEFGVDPEAVDQLARPFLIRRRVTPMSGEARQRFAQQLNADSMARSGAAETATADASRLDAPTLGKLQPGSLLGRANEEFVQEWLNRVPENERNELLSGGQLSSKGLDRLQAAVFAKAYGGEAQTKNLLTRMAESTDDEVRGLTSSLTRAAPAIARLRAAIETGDRAKSLDIAPAIAKAISTIADVKGRGEKLESFLRTGSMFPRDPAEQVLLDAVAMMGRRTRMLGDLLENYAALAERTPSPKQGGLLGAVEAPKAVDLLRRAGVDAQGGLFAGDDPTLGSQVMDLQAQLRGAIANNEPELAENIRAQLALLKEGVDTTNTKLGGPGAASPGELYERLKQGLGLGDATDEQARVTVDRLKDVPEFLTFVNGPAFAFRKIPEVERIVQTGKRFFKDVDRLRRVLLERPGIEGQPASGGYRSIEAKLPAAEREPLQALWWKTSLEGRDPTPAEIRAAGLSENAVHYIRQTRRLLSNFIDLVVNPAMKRLELPPVPKRGGYLMHRWFGSFDLYKESEPGVWSRLTDLPQGSTARTEAEAWSWLRPILKADPEGRYQIRPRYRDFLRDVSGAESPDARPLARMLEQAESDETVGPEALREADRRGISPQGFSRHFLEQKGSIGFERQLFGRDGMIDRYLSEGSRWVPMRVAADAMARQAKMLDEVPRLGPNVKRAIDRFIYRVSGRAGAVETALDDVLRRLPILGQHLDPVRPTMRQVRRIRGVMSHLKLGLMAVGSGMVNALQFATHAAPLLDADVAARAAFRAWVPDAEAVRWLTRFEKLGEIDPLFTRGEGAGSTLGTLQQLSFWPMMYAEKINRRATLLGAMYQLAKNGEDPKGSRIIQLATDFARKNFYDLNERTRMALAARVNSLTNFDYDLASRPPWTTGPLGELAGQFKSYTVHTMELEKRMWDLARKGDVKPLAQHFGTLFLLSGAVGMPFTFLFDAVAQKALGVSPIDELTKTLPSWAVRGLPVLAGADASRRIGLGDAIGTQDITDLGGPAVSTLIEVLADIQANDYDMLARRVAQGPGSFYSAYRMWADQAEREPNSRARLRFTPEPRDVFFRFMGFSPWEATHTGDLVRIQKRATDAYKEGRARLIDQAVAARQAGDIAKSAEIIRGSRAAGTPITYDDVLKEQEAKRTSTVERLLKRTPLPLRPAAKTAMAPDLEHERGAALLRRRLGGR